VAATALKALLMLLFVAFGPYGKESLSLYLGPGDLSVVVVIWYVLSWIFYISLDILPIDLETH